VLSVDQLTRVRPMLVLGIITGPVLEVLASTDFSSHYWPRSDPVSAALHSWCKYDHSNMDVALSATNSQSAARCAAETFPLRGDAGMSAVCWSSACIPLSGQQIWNRILSASTGLSTSDVTTHQMVAWHGCAILQLSLSLPLPVIHWSGCSNHFHSCPADGW